MTLSEVSISKLLIEAYAKIQDKEPIYTFRKSHIDEALNLAEVLMEGKEVGYVVIVDETTDTILHEYRK
jgi:hypothetical protein